MAESNRTRFDTHMMLTSLAMSTPAIRMVAVNVAAYRLKDGEWADDDYEIYPVLALVAKQEHEYHRQHVEGRSDATSPTHEGMEQLGWHHSGTESHLVFDAVIYDRADYGVIDAEFALGQSSNAAYKVVPAPWLPEDDAERLAPVIEELRSKARAMETRRAEEASNRSPKNQ